MADCIMPNSGQFPFRTHAFLAGIHHRPHEMIKNERINDPRTAHAKNIGTNGSERKKWFISFSFFEYLFCFNIDWIHDVEATRGQPRQEYDDPPRHPSSSMGQLMICPSACELETTNGMRSPPGPNRSDSARIAVASETLEVSIDG